MRPCPSSSGSKELRPSGVRRRGARSGVGAREAGRAAPVCGWVGGVAADRGDLWPVEIARGGGDARARRTSTGHGVARRFGWRSRCERAVGSRQSSIAPTVVPTTRNPLGSRNEGREGSQVLGGRADRALGGLGQRGECGLRRDVEVQLGRLAAWRLPSTLNTFTAKRDTKQSCSVSQERINSSHGDWRRDRSHRRNNSIYDR